MMNKQHQQSSIQDLFKPHRMQPVSPSYPKHESVMERYDTHYDLIIIIHHFF